MNRMILAAAVFVLLASGCGPNQRIIESSNAGNRTAASEAAEAPSPAATTFEQDLEAMRTADFEFVYVFRRKDGGVLDASDKSFIAQTSPAEMNRRRLSDNGKAVIIGSNFRMPPQALETLKEVFAFEDYSRGER